MINQGYLVFFKKLSVVWILFCAFYPVISAQSNRLFIEPSIKLELNQSGIYKLNYTWITENIGANPDPSRWQLWSGSPNIKEIPIDIVGYDDGSFDTEDFVLFYWDHSQLEHNSFDTRGYVYLTVEGQDGLRISKQAFDDIPNPIITNHHLNTYSYNELKFNLLHEDPSNSGSGQLWVGEEISNNKVTDIAELLEIPVQEELYSTSATIVVRSDENEQISLNLNGKIKSATARSVDLGDVEDEFGKKVELSFVSGELDNSGYEELENLEVVFNKNSNQAQAWIDELAATTKAPMIYSGNQVIYQPIAKDETNLGAIQSNNKNITIWKLNIDDELRELGTTIQADEILFNINGIDDRFIIFDRSDNLLIPSSTQKVNRFELQELSTPDLLIIYHGDFESEALRLKNHRESFSGYSVAAVEDQLVYDQYASGRKTPEALRLFAKSLYVKNQRLKYLLLIGDGSFDYNHVYSELPNEHFIPTYETVESLDPLEAFPTDDYFALLDEENPSSLIGDLDIAVGRLPVKNLAEAEAVVTKIINYDVNKATVGSWRNNIIFLADDEDFNLHIDDADEIADKIEINHKTYIKNKIYWDAYAQVSTPGGNRYPEANNELNRAIDQGLLVMNYLGHGGAIGWSQERVLNVTDIESWSNFNKLPLIITATCSFTGFDDPTISSAGELALLNPVGGAVALFTTVRSVYASKNFRLTSAVYDILFDQENGAYLPIGEILRRSKNNTTTRDINARKFLLIGDPSMTLAYPRRQVIINSFNNNPTDDEEDIDTIGALDLVQFSGIVSNDGLTPMLDFSGTVEVILYDKPSKIETLQNDSRSLFKTFDLRKNILYKGIIKVTDGFFEGQFIIPVDIDYAVGQGKMSLYAQSGDGIDGTGYYDQFIIAGTSETPITDDSGPDINLFLNTRQFLSGDRTDSNPMLIVDLSDESGINLSQVSIGHEITAILDGDTQSTIILNDQFVSNSTDNTSSGSVQYRLQNLRPGPHHLELRAFDIANNLSIAEIDFIVDPVLDNQILEFSINPNILLVNEAKLTIAHNLNQINDIQIELYDSVGKYLGSQGIRGPYSDQTIDGNLNLSNQNAILTNGVYLCRVKIEVATGEEIFSDLKRLVILK